MGAIADSRSEGRVKGVRSNDSGKSSKIVNMLPGSGSCISNILPVSGTQGTLEAVAAHTTPSAVRIASSKTRLAPSSSK